MAGSLRSALDAAVCILQGEWYAADSYAARTGLYHWSDPTLPRYAVAHSSLISGAQDMRCWWNSANAITALIDYMIVTNQRTYIDAVEYTFTKAQNAYTLNFRTMSVITAAAASAGMASGVIYGAFRTRPATTVTAAVVGTVTGAACGAATAGFRSGRNYLRNFINATPGGFYDDEAWWALAWLRAYDLTRNGKFLTMAITIFQDMASGWDDACGGGVYWRRDGADMQGRSPYKNAIANELFLALAAGISVRLNETPGSPGSSPFFTWALREWQWFASSGLINNRNLVNDGLTTSASPGRPCISDGSAPVWSYNQGVILGALCDMHKITGDPGYLTTAKQIADALLSNRVRTDVRESGVDDQGILTEQGDRIGSDVGGAQFKGIFVRNLARLHARMRSKQHRDFLNHNANSAIAHKDASGHYGMRWNAETDRADFVRQTAAVDLLNAALSTQDGTPPPGG